MEIIKVTLENWGPFEGQHIINFNSVENSKASILYGNNGKGKTSFFNAISYALYGETKDGFEPGKFANWFRIKNGKSFEVSVEIIYQSNNELTILKRSFVAVPQNTNNLDVILENKTVTMRVDEIIIKQNDIDNRIRKELPEEISRFFLFDGEELKKISDALSSGTSVSKNAIKDGIESILGVPALKKLKKELLGLSNILEREIDRNNLHNQKNDDLNKSLDELAVEIKNLNDEIVRQDNLIKSYEEDNKDILSVLEKDNRAESDVANYRSVKSNIDTLNSDLDISQKTLKNLLDDYWYLPIFDKIKNMDEVSRNYKNEIQDTQLEIYKLDNKISYNNKLLENSFCSACLQPVKVNKQEIEEEIVLLTKEIIVLKSKDIKHIGDIWSSLYSNVLKDKNVIDNEFKEVAKYKSRIANLKDQEQILNNRLKDVDKNKFAEKILERDANNAAIIKGEDNRKKCIETLRLKELEQKKLKNKIIDTQEISSEQRIKLNYYNKLVDFVEQLILEFSSKARLAVQEKASSHYIELMNNNDILGLEITEDYDIFVIHRQIGRKPTNNMGATLVLVYAFIGGLIDVSGNTSAWVIDTPIARLDDERAPATWKWIANRNRQVIVLPQKKELNHEEAYLYFGSTIANQYNIVSESGTSDASSKFERIK